MSDFNLGAALQSYKENSEITTLDPGTYRLECTSATAGQAKAGPTIMPVFKVVSGPLAGKRVLLGKMSFAETALWKTIPQIKGFGVTDEFLLQANSQPDPIKTVANALVGRVIDATVNIEPYQGEDRNKLVSVRIATDHTAAPPAPPATAAPAPVAIPVPDREVAVPDTTPARAPSF